MIAHLELDLAFEVRSDECRDGQTSRDMDAFTSWLCEHGSEFSIIGYDLGAVEVSEEEEE